MYETFQVGSMIQLVHVVQTYECEYAVCIIIAVMSVCFVCGCSCDSELQ